MTQNVANTNYVAPTLLPKAELKNFLPHYDKTLPSHDFGAFTHSRKTNEIYVDSVDGLLWQPDVYRYAKEVADANNITNIVDLGCGNGEKLLQSFLNPRYSIMGIDYAGSLELVRKNHPKQTWIDANFTNGEAISQAFAQLPPDQPKLFILSDVIEHIIDPRLLFRKLRAELKRNPNNLLLISTPDSEKGVTYDPETKLPLNTAHVREWSLTTLCEFMVSSGFTLNEAGHTRSNTYDTDICTCLTLVSASETAHAKLLRAYELPKPKPSMIISTEHADTVRTGGIGSYIKELERVTKSSKPIVLMCGHAPFQDLMTTPEKAENIVDLHQVLPIVHFNLTIDWYSLSTDVYEAVRDLCYLYDQLSLIEYQEYLGIGARLAQAKKMGDIPAEITLVARCHGSQVYIDRAAFRWSDARNGDVFELERMSIRYADRLSFPTKYLRDLYLSTGYDFDTANSDIDRLPYSYPKRQDIKHTRITKLGFIGKRGAMKGYDAFLSVVREVTDPSNSRYCPSIKHIVVFGSPVEHCEVKEDAIRELLEPRGVMFCAESLPRAELLTLLEENSSDTLFCLPYGADNHPVTVLEMIAYQCPFIAYASGGIPELIPEEFHDFFLVAPDASWLAEKVHTVVVLKPAILADMLLKLHRRATSDQKSINSHVLANYTLPKAPKTPNKDIVVDLGSLATIIVPVYDTDLGYVEKLLISFNRLATRPKEIIFIDDASPSPEYNKRLNRIIGRTLKVPYRVITHPENLGLSGARNTGLANCTTKYLINVDSDDIVSNDFLYDYVTFLEENSEYAVAVCGLEAFSGVENWETVFPKDDRYRYVGIGDSYVLGITKNVFGHSGSCVRTEEIRSIGGWDATDKSMWEDWAFYLKLVSLGRKIFCFPKVNYFYRVNEESMLRSYPEYPASLRIVRNIGGINIWESQRLFAYLREGVRLAHTPLPEPEIQIVPVEPDTFAYHTVAHIRNFLHRHSYTRRALKAGMRLAWKTSRVVLRRP